MERRNNSKHELITEDMIQSYCNIFGIDVESVTEGVLKAMEDSMQLNKEKRVYARHPYALPDPESYANGRQKTRVKSEDSPGETDRRGEKPSGVDAHLCRQAFGYKKHI